MANSASIAIDDIPICLVTREQGDAYLKMDNFFVWYDKTEPGEIGTLCDKKTMKPIMRVVCD